MHKAISSKRKRAALDNVKSISEVITKPNADLITRLEAMLEDAKSGELIGVAYVQQWKGDLVNSSWCVADMNARKLIGEIEFMKRDLLRVVE